MSELACPNCHSTNLHHGCCGDTSSTCRSCGFIFDLGFSTPCPIDRPLEPTAEISLTEPLKNTIDYRLDKDYEELTDNELWGI